MPLGALHSARLLTSHRGAICAHSLTSELADSLRLIMCSRSHRGVWDIYTPCEPTKIFGRAMHSVFQNAKRSRSNLRSLACASTDSASLDYHKTVSLWALSPMLYSLLADRYFGRAMRLVLRSKTLAEQSALTRLQASLQTCFA